MQIPLLPITGDSLFLFCHFSSWKLIYLIPQFTGTFEGNRFSCPSEKLDQGKIMGKSHTKTGHKIKIKWNLKLDTILFKKNPYLKNNQ
jgi:hypothetical protein